MVEPTREVSQCGTKEALELDAKSVPTGVEQVPEIIPQTTDILTTKIRPSGSAGERRSYEVDVEELSA